MIRPKISTRFVEPIEQAMGGLAIWAFRRWGRALTLVLAVSLLAGVFAARLTLNADLAELLPPSFPSVKNLEIAKAKFGGFGYVVVVGKDADPKRLRAFADEVGPRLEALSNVAYVEVRQPTEFFADRALYFLSTEDLEAVRDRLARRADWERLHRNPLYVDLEDSEPPPVDFSDILDKYRSRFGNGTGTEAHPDGYYLDASSRAVLLLVKPRGLSSNMAFSKEITRDVESTLAAMDLTRYGPDFHVALAGTYSRKVEQEELIAFDLKLASLIALVLILAFLTLHFRRVHAVAFVMGPLVVGLLWTYGFTGAVFGSLNILSAFIGAILIGLGIDHGIHLLARFESEHAAGVSHRETIRRAFGLTGRTVAIAAVTTSIGFAFLGLSDFRAFREFGVVAAVGSTLIVAAYSVCLPAFLGVAVARRFRPRPPEAMRPSSFARWLPRRAPLVFTMCLVVAAGVSLDIPQNDFNSSLAALQGTDLPSFRLDEEVNRILGRSQSPVVVSADSPGEERAVVDALRHRMEERGAASTIDFVAGLSDFVPEGQSTKQVLLAEIGEVIDGIDRGWIDDEETVDKLERLREMTKARPFGRDDLPDEVVRRFRGPGARNGESFVLVFNGVSLHDGEEVRRFAREIRDLPIAEGEMRSATGEPMILADILEMVYREAPPVLLLTVAAVFVSLWIFLGSLGASIACLVPALGTVLVTLGLAPLCNIELNYLNIVMVPVLFGIGVDGSAHIVTRTARGDALSDVIHETGRAIAGAILTTALGFGSLVVTSHAGLRSLGAFAVLGLGVNFLACIVALPAFLSLGRKRKADA